jgi:hypothetical protein
MMRVHTSVSRVIVAGTVALFVGLLTPVAIDANHQWGNYRWPLNGGGPIDLLVVDNLTSDWDASFDAAIWDWDHWGAQNQWPDALTIDTYRGSKSSDCPPTVGRIDVCNGNYGSNGWLGIAQIWVSGGTDIVQATTKLNDYYFENHPTYSDPLHVDAWRRFVMCQEIGHDFGLDHQDEAFYNPNLGSCMDYTAWPEDNIRPNQHDFEQLGAMYLSSTTDGGGGKKKPGGGGGGGGGRGKGVGGQFPDVVPDVALSQVPMDSPGQWGQLVRSNGRVALYDLDLGFGNHIFTFVVWAL